MYGLAITVHIMCRWTGASPNSHAHRTVACKTIKQYVSPNGSITEENEEYSRSPNQQNGNIAIITISTTSLNVSLIYKLMTIAREVMNRSANRSRVTEKNVDENNQRTISASF